MTSISIAFAGSVFFAAVLLVLIAAYVRNAYREYDRKESLKEGIIDYRARIKSAQDYFRETYDHNVYNNIKTNLDFCLKIIYNKSPEDQVKGLKNLYDTLYETGYRLKTNYDDVQYILSPLKNFRERIFIEWTDYIKENYDE